MKCLSAFEQLTRKNAELIEQARKEAMEECAKVCADDESGRDSGYYFAELIRARMK